MPVNVPDIRTGSLSNSESIVPGSDIQRYINTWTRRVVLRAGEKYVEDPMAQEAIRLGAFSWAMRDFDLANQRDVSQDSKDAYSQAGDLLKDLDEMTGTSDESGGIYEGLVSNVSDDPLWSAEDFGLNRGSSTSW